MSARSFFESEHHRMFIKEGTVLKAKTDFSDSSERYLFMCSDVILISQVINLNRTLIDLYVQTLCMQNFCGLRTLASSMELIAVSLKFLPLQPSSRSRKTFRLKERVMLVHAWVTDTATNGGKVPERGFILGTPRRIYHFLAASVGEKNSWFQELQTHIFKQKRLFNRV